MKTKVKRPAGGAKRVARTLAYPLEFRLRTSFRSLRYRIDKLNLE